MTGSLAIASPTASIIPRFWSDKIASTISAVNQQIDLGIRPIRNRPWANDIDSDLITTECSNQSSTISELCTLTFTSAVVMPEETILYLPPKRHYKIDIEIHQIIKASPNLVLSDWSDEDNGFDL